MSSLRPRRHVLPHRSGTVSLLEAGGGDSAPLLLIHGFAADAFSWQYVLVPLAKRRRVLAIDLPGHGGGSTMSARDWTLPSLIDWVVAATEAAAPHGAHIAAHSLGGRLALAVAEARPDLVHSLSIVASAGLGAAFDLALLDNLIAADTPARAALALASIARGGDRDALARAHAAKMSDPASRAALTAIRDQVLRPAAQVFTPVDWTRIDMPVGLIWGDADRVIPCPTAAELPARLEIERLAEVGHLPHIEQPSAVIAMVERTIAQCGDMPARLSA